MASFIQLLLLSLIITSTTTNRNDILVQADPDLSFVISYCGPRQLPADPLLKGKAYEATERAVTGTFPNDSPYCGSVEEDPYYVYTQSYCYPKLDKDDCNTCLRSARDRLIDGDCRNGYGAQIVLMDCYIRYETHKFCG